MRYLLIAIVLLAGCSAKWNPLENSYAVQVIRPNGSFCSGVWVSPKAVATARHCLQGPGDHTVLSLKGRHTTHVTQVLGGAGAPSDFGLLLFDAPQVPADYALPIAARLGIGEGVKILGVGCTDIHAQGGTGILREGHNTVSGLDLLIRLSSPTVGSLIVGFEAAGSCFGDSGGPLVRTPSRGSVQLAGTATEIREEAVSTYSFYVPLPKYSAARTFLENANQEHALGITFEE